MAQQIQCAHCGARYEVSEQLAGTLVDCRKCQTRIMVPRKPAAGPGAPAVPAPRGDVMPAVKASVPVRPPAARAPAAPPRPVPPAPTAQSSRPKPPPKEEDEVIRFREDDEDEPRSRPATDLESDEPFDLAPAPPAPRSPGGGSIAGRSRAGETRAGQSRAGQTRAGESTAGQSRAGQSRSGQSQASQSRAGQSRAGQSRAGQSRAGQSSVGSVAGASASRSGQALERQSGGIDEEINIPDFADLLGADPSNHTADDDDFKFTIPVLPPLVIYVLMPWALAIAGLGIAGYIAVSHALALPGKPVGLSMIGGALLLYVALLVPLTLRAIYSAADTAELRLPSVVWFQTFSMLALPTAGLALGYDAGGTGPMITLGVLGLLAMSVFMAFMFRANVMQTLLTAFYGASAYIGSAALCAGILVGVGLILGHEGLVVPWQPAPAALATTQPTAPTDVAVAQAPTPAAAPVAATQPTVVAVTASVPAAPAAPIEPAGPPWHVAVEPIATGLMWPAEGKEIRTSIEVDTPVVTAHAPGGAPFVALLQPRSTAIYDLRNGTRAGFIKSAFEPHDLILSPDGAALAGVELATSDGGMFAGADGAAGSIEIWSTADNRMVGRVPGMAGVAIPVPLGFAGGRLIASGSSKGMTGLQAWDPATGSLLQQWNTMPVTRSSMAISNSGQFVAVAANAVVRIFNVASGEVAGELSAPVSLQQTQGIAFSPDGTTLAALVPAVPSPALQSPATSMLLEWDIAAGGKLTRSLPIEPTVPTPPTGVLPTAIPVEAASDVPTLQWTPDGRMVRVGDGLFETTSGKAIATLPAQMSGNLNGRLIAVANKRSVYEFLPTGIGSHLLLKTVDLPTAVIDPAVAWAKASAQKMELPKVEVASIGGAAAGGIPTGSATLTAASTLSGSAPAVNAMMVWPSVASPTGSRATDQLAWQGQWDVQVKALIKADPALIQSEQQALNASIAQTQSALHEAQLKFDHVAKYHDSIDGSGQTVRQYDYTDAGQAGAHHLVQTLQDQLRDEQARSTKLDAAAAAAPDARNVLGTLDNGVVVHITTDTDSAAAAVDALHAGDRAHVVGFGQNVDGILQVKLKSASLIPIK